MYLYSDVEDPLISGLPANMIIPTSASAEVVTWPAPSASDNSGMVSLTTSHEPGMSFPLGVTMVIYTAIDSSGNTVTASFTITIQGMLDYEC